MKCNIAMYYNNDPPLEDLAESVVRYAMRNEGAYARIFVNRIAANYLVRAIFQASDRQGNFDAYYHIGTSTFRFANGTKARIDVQNGLAETPVRATNAVFVHDLANVKDGAIGFAQRHFSELYITARKSSLDKDTLEIIGNLSNKECTNVFHRN